GSPVEASRAAASGNPGERLLFADDFADPGSGLFLDHQRGPGQVRSEGETFEYQWEYAYADHALVGRLRDYPPNANATVRNFSSDVTAANRVLGDFAVEVQAWATKSIGECRYGLNYSLAAGDSYWFWIVPQSGSNGIFWEKGL